MSRAFRRVRSSDHAGVVLVAALLALVLLASAVFFVFNVGTHIHRKIETQHAADAAAIAGAGWVARTMNLVAMNNVESAR
ncbi:MAG: pilus assembly protein TadG-related protein, partial [Planctomycetota bacterium]